MSLTIRELAPWGEDAALLIDGGDVAPERPVFHLQAAGGGYLRLVGPDGPIVWGLVDSGYYGVDVVRAKTTVHPLPPLRSAEVEEAPGAAGSTTFIAWWTRRFAQRLCASPCTPLARGRRHLLASTSCVAAAVPGMTAARVPQRQELDKLLDQRDEFFLRWDFGYDAVLLTRQFSAADDGRVKMWRKRAREKRLPPIVTWWCRGLFTHVLLDGHDRLLAALCENVPADAIVLADAVPQSSDSLDALKQQTLEQAALLESVPIESRRAQVMNTILKPGWDPRAEWQLATPGFPLDGGVEQWEAEIRGTMLEAALAHRREAAAQQ